MTALIVGSIFIAVLAMVTLAVILKAWVFSYLWAWFITPIFGTEVPNFWVLCGFMMTIYFLVYQQQDIADPEDWKEALWKAIGRLVVAPLIVLGVGYVLQGLV